MHDDNLDPVFAELPPLLTPAEVAETLRMSVQGVYTWLKDGTLPGYKISGTWYVLRDALRDTLEQGKYVPTTRTKTRPTDNENTTDDPTGTTAAGPGPGADTGVDAAAPPGDM